MAAEESLKIRIGADIVEVTKSLDVLQGELQSLEKQLKSATPGSAQFNQLAANFTRQQEVIKGVNQAIAQTNPQLRNLAGNTGQANTALVNFGRVVQDAPFGLIGIANNIDPLISSFQQLKAQTGSSASAFRALAASLAGPAGIAIAVSAVTSALIAFGPQIQAAVNGVSEFNKALIESGRAANEEFSKASNEANRFFSILIQGNATTLQQENILKSLNKTFGEYGFQIANITELQRNSVNILTLYARLRQEEARQTALASLAAEAYANNIAAITKAQQVASRGFFLEGTSIPNLLNIFNFRGAANESKAAANAQKLYEQSLGESQSALDELVKQLRETPGITDKVNAKIRQTKEEAKAAKDEVSGLRGEFTAIRQTIDDGTEAFDKRVQAYTDGAAKAAASFKALRDEELRLQGIDPTGATEPPQSRAGTQVIPVNQFELEKRLEEIKKLKAAQQELNQLAESFGLTIGNAFTDFFLSVGKDGPEAFKQLGQAIKETTTRLLVQLAVAKALSLLFPSSAAFSGARQAGRALGLGLFRNGFWTPGI